MLQALRNARPLALAAALLATTAFAQAPSTQTSATPKIPVETLERLEAPRTPGVDGDAGLRFDELLEAHDTPALSVAVVRDYRIAWAHAWGIADPRNGTPATTETLFQAASISKPVSAMAILRAVQDGHFGLDDDINDLLTSWELAHDAEHLSEATVTPRLLLSMKAGTTVPGFPGYHPDDPLPTVPQVLGYPRAQTTANTDPVVVDWTPGTREEYSGGGSTILQLALSDALERPFAEILQETVLDPLGMTSSCFCQPLPQGLHARAASAWGTQVERDAQIGRAPARWHVYPELYAAGLWTTATDLARFLIGVQSSLDGRSTRVLNQDMARKMVTPGGVGHYALGFTTGTVTPHRPAPPGEPDLLFGHTGGNWGFRGNFVGSLEGGNGYVILANSSDANPVVFFELPARLRALYDEP
ncbi:MAG: serine hydrolase domain-containing protein [Acidobacteriota bacterium]